MARFGSLLAVVIGGMTGAFARWGLLTLSADDRSELVIFALNVVGAGLLGALLGVRPIMSETRFELVGTGFAGGLTTFSTFAVTVAQHLEDGKLLAAATNGLGTMIIAVVVAGIGYRLSRIAQIRRLQRVIGKRR